MAHNPLGAILNTHKKDTKGESPYGRDVERTLAMLHRRYSFADYRQFLLHALYYTRINISAKALW